MIALPAFKIDKKLHSMLVKSNCDNQYVFLLQHCVGKMKQLLAKKLHNYTVSTECKIWESKEIKN